MTSTKSAAGLLIAAMLSGWILGSAVSVTIAGESAYGVAWWSQFTHSLALSPVLMTIGMLVSLGTLGLGFFALLCAGMISVITSLFLGIRRRFPRPQWLMFVGTFFWSLGNATAMETMMGI